MKLLIENGSIVTVNAGGDVFPRGYLYCEADRIVALDAGSPPDSLPANCSVAGRSTGSNRAPSPSS